MWSRFWYWLTHPPQDANLRILTSEGRMTSEITPKQILMLHAAGVKVPPDTLKQAEEEA